MKMFPAYPPYPTAGLMLLNVELDKVAEMCVGNVLLNVIGLWRRLLDTALWPDALKGCQPFTQDLWEPVSSQNASDLPRPYTKSIPLR